MQVPESLDLEHYQAMNQGLQETPVAKKTKIMTKNT
jgi:hypothetical protein